MRARVSSGSVIQILDVPYTVPSRLIHYTLKVYVYPDEIILFYGNKKLQTMPRVSAKSLAGINYRHIIDSLIRKPARLQIINIMKHFSHGYVLEKPMMLCAMARRRMLIRVSEIITIGKASFRTRSHRCT